MAGRPIRPPHRTADSRDPRPPAGHATDVLRPPPRVGLARRAAPNPDHPRRPAPPRPPTTQSTRRRGRRPTATRRRKPATHARARRRRGAATHRPTRR
jgi:hypothetical protein